MRAQIRHRSILLLAGALSVAVAAQAPGALGQLRTESWRAPQGQVYQLLQFRSGDDRGTGLDEIRVTSLVASSFAARTCGTPLPADPRHPLEALAYGPIAGNRPLDLAFKSGVIADASAACFDGDANDGLGAVCVGPGCGTTCSCADGDSCAVFSITDGTTLTTATPDVPAAHTVLPLRVQQRQCDVSNAITYGFGVPMQATSRGEVCTPAPSDGFRLPGTPSAFPGGTDGTSLVLAYEATPQEVVTVAAAGFGIDTDGSNPFDCDAPGMVVAALQAMQDDDGSTSPPGPPVDLSREEQRCQRAVGRAARRFLSRLLRALQQCRERILAERWPIAAEHCLEQPRVARMLSSAARSARSKLTGSCDGVDLGHLLVCGDSIDDLFGPEGVSGCLLESHRDMAEQLVRAEFGF